MRFGSFRNLGEIQGNIVRLEPLEPKDLPLLYNVLGHKLVFASGFGGGLSAYREDPFEFAEWAGSFLPFDHGQPFLIRVQSGKYDGEPIGTVSLADVADDPNQCELGWSGYDPRVWNTAVNAETKLILLGEAFKKNFDTVRVHADHYNLRQALPPELLNRDEQGVDQIEPESTTDDVFRRSGSQSGSGPDIYEIHRFEWTALKKRLEQRIAQYGNLPIRLSNIH